MQSIDSEHVTIHNVRNLITVPKPISRLTTETRAYDLSQLRGLDLFLNYWGSPLIAHPIVSFDFGGQGHICLAYRDAL